MWGFVFIRYKDSNSKIRTFTNIDKWWDQDVHDGLRAADSERRLRRCAWWCSLHQRRSHCSLWMQQIWQQTFQECRSVALARSDTHWIYLLMIHQCSCHNSILKLTLLWPTCTGTAYYQHHHHCAWYSPWPTCTVTAYYQHHHRRHNCTTSNLEWCECTSSKSKKGS